MKTVYFFPVLLFLFLAVVLLSLPDLRSCPLPSHCRSERRPDRRDALLMAGISLLYAAVAFTGLGEREGVQSFALMDGKSAVIDLGGEKHVGDLVFYSGVGEGCYLVEYSQDGNVWIELTQYQQNHISVFKWNRQASPPVQATHLRLTGYGPVYLGEFSALDPKGTPLPLSCSVAELTDEQQLIQTEEHFMSSTYFDEIYHARTAWEHLQQVQPYEVSHPPLGKLIISLGLLLFGSTPFGWRFMGTLFGVLMLPLIYLFSKKLFGGRSVPTLCTILLATDFMHFVQTRIATIDTYGVFFILLMYYFMYEFVSVPPQTSDKRSLSALAFSGICFGLGVAAKWTAVYAGGGLAVIWLAYWIVHRDLGWKAFAKNAAFCLLFFVLLPGLIYYLSYFPYGLAKGLSAPGMFFQSDYARIVLDNQDFMFHYHSSLVAEHPYSSRWYQWLLDIRPILYYLKSYADGTRSSFGAFVNPLLCWGGLLCLPVLLYSALARRDRQAAFILVSYLAQLLPWVFIQRLTFAYHYFPCTIFLVLAFGYVCKLLRLGQRQWKLLFGSIAFCSAALFLLFYPALSGYRVDNAAASALLGWLPGWPF